MTLRKILGMNSYTANAASEFSSSGWLKEEAGSAASAGVSLRQLAGAAGELSLAPEAQRHLSHEEGQLLRALHTAVEFGHALLAWDCRLAEVLAPLRLAIGKAGQRLSYVDAASRRAEERIETALKQGNLLVVENVHLLSANAGKLLDQSLESAEDDLPLLASANRREWVPPPLLKRFRQYEPERIQAATPKKFSPFERLTRLVRHAFGAGTEHPSEWEIPRGKAIEKLPEWPLVDAKVRRRLEEVSRLLELHREPETISVSKDYPKVVGFIWRHFDGDLPRTAERALAHCVLRGLSLEKRGILSRAFRFEKDRHAH